MVATLRRVLSIECDIVGTAEDGATLLDLAARLQPDVVLADLNMPGLNGFEACRQLTRSNSRLGVILLSGHEDPELARHALAAGASAFFVKYLLVPQELIAAVKRARAEDSAHQG
jgi:DNA-binding NarL/FixJ family response regulator